MSEPVKVDSVKDAESGEEVGIAPVQDVQRDSFIEDAYRMNMFEIVTAVTLAVILITFAIGISRVL